MDRGAWQAAVHGVTRVGHDLVTKSPNSGKGFLKQNSKVQKMRQKINVPDFIRIKDFCSIKVIMERESV